MPGLGEVVAFLSDGATYGLPGAEVKRIETHCSIVFLAGDRAYKLKRHIAFSSLDYSTLERREAACRAELDLNRRTAPELYLGLRAICRTADGRLAFDGGPTLDWVVVMRRFDEADLFDCLLDAGQLTADRIRGLADEIARFHESAACVSAFGGAEGLREAIERNRCDQLIMGEVLGFDAIEAVHKASCEALRRAASLLDRRRDEGKVRRCHGDLRLANLCLLDGRATLFDAIEFSDRVSCVDVLFDVAFLVMDLHHRGQGVFANLLLNRYLDVTGEGGLAAMPLLLSVRAATRAYSLAGSVERQTSGQGAQRQAAAARAHLASALSLLSKPRPRVVALGGLEGSSKSSLANSLAATFHPAPGARVLRGEAVRKRLLGVPASARLAASAYTPEIDERVHAGLAAAASQAVKAGFTAIIDAGFIYPAERQAIAAAAAANAAPFIGVWLGSPRGLSAGEARGADGWHAIEPVSGAGESGLAAVRALVHARSRRATITEAD